MLPQGAVPRAWTAEVSVEVDENDLEVFGVVGEARGSREGQTVEVEITGRSARPTKHAARFGIQGLERYRRTAKLELGPGWVRKAESKEEFVFVLGGQRRRVVVHRCRVRVARLGK